LLTVNALAIATEVIIPMQPHFLALQGVAKILETVQLVSRRINQNLKVSGVLLTMFDSQTKLSNEVVAELKRFIEEAAGKPLPWAEARIFKTKIRRNIKLAESPSFGQHILKYEPTSNGAADYRALAREVVEMTEPGFVGPVVNAPAKPTVKVNVNTNIDQGKLVAAKVGPPPAAAPTPAPASVAPVRDDVQQEVA
jgi:chromosome partitioning protein